MRFSTRVTALCLSFALALGPCALAGESASLSPLTPAQKQEDLDALYDTLRQAHPNLFANTSEAEFLAEKVRIEDRLDLVGDFEFTLELQALTALVGDSHTTTSLGSVGEMRFFPFSTLWFDGQWHLAAVDAAYGEAVGEIVTALGGVEMDQVLQRFSRLVSADNPVKLRRQTGQLLYCADVLEYLGLIQPGGTLTLTLLREDGTVGEITLSPLTDEEMGQISSFSVNSLRQERPITAYDRSKYYFSLPLDEQTYYIQYNRCQQDPELPMADFAGQVAQDLEAGGYTQVLLDLRNNGGGSDGVIHPLLMVLAPAVREGRLRLWGLIGETTYSSAVINAVMIPDVGGWLAGSPTSGSVDHFGAVRSFNLPNSGLRVNHSTKWIDLATLLETALPFGVEPLTPHVTITPTWEDYLAGRDTEVEYLLAHGADYQPPDRGEDPLTRGYLLTLLYGAAQSAGREVSAPECPFWDAIPFACYAPAANWAAQAGIAAGDGEGALSPARPVTRAEAAVMLLRFAEYMGLELPAGEVSYSDGALIPAWAQEAAQQAQGLGLTSFQDGFFRPNDPLTRQEGEALAAGLTAS